MESHVFYCVFRPSFKNKPLWTQNILDTKKDKTKTLNLFYSNENLEKNN